MFDSAAIRSQFPVLNRRINGRPLVYLDNAATSLKPHRVLQAEMDFYTRCGANVHRGKHALSQEASELLEQARDAVVQHLNAESPRSIIFVANTTDALNMVAGGLGLSSNDEIIATTLEHHSNLVPWMRVANVRFLDAPADRAIDPDAVALAIGPMTRAVVIGYASNTTGVVQPVAEICRICRERGVLSVVDAAQAMAHLQPDVRQLGCDFLAFSGHKVFAPMGTGVLYGREDALARLEPARVGGGTVDRVTQERFALRTLPHRLEAGTANVGGIIALAEALRFHREIGAGAAMEHGEELVTALRRSLSTVKGIRVLGANQAPRLPIVSVVLEEVGLSADDVAMMLSDRHAIMTRSGFHCAHPFFDAVRAAKGALRASALIYNTVEETQLFSDALEETIAPFRRR